MSVEKNRKRRIGLLKKIAERAKWRHDVKVPLADVAPTIDVEHKFLDRDDPKRESGSDLAFDFNTLQDEGLIARDWMGHTSPDSRGHTKGVGPAVKVTPKGLEVIAESNKSWLKKAIDKQPITFL